MADSLRLVLVTDFFHPYVGGGPVHQGELARGLAARGHEVDVVTCRLPSTAREEALGGVRIHRVGPAGRASRYGFAWRALGLTRRLARRADAVQATTFVGALPGSLGGRLAGTPTLLTAFEVFQEDWAAFLPQRPLQARALRLAEAAILRLPYDAVAAISAHTQQRLERFGWGPGRSSVIPCGIDQEFWAPGRAEPARFRQEHGIRDPFLFLFFGRAGISKGLPPLLDAAAQALPRLPGARLVLVLSPGELEAWCRQRVASTPALRKRVTILPSLDRARLRDAVAAADAVVLPSLSEGFGLAHAEACALGRPVVSTDAGPLPEVVTGRRILVPPGDAAALARALEQAHAGQWDSVPVRRFSWAATVEAYEAAFRTLADRRG